MEVLVPIIERLIKNNILEANNESKQFLSKMSSTLFQYNNMNKGKHKNIPKKIKFLTEFPFN